ncbi:hypothetical protein JAAARDRAFT_211512 [Jaapia argillacea MUCL 33604]|uniref:Protein kinase domain-containing protein n=1 Tax=Jaapia argillacea MUCL 33604 TaxID=933084 RepID=A0A067PIK5_9AGAM|nr:hypothetical protein JAAARDRAFT_211512 [Jaapia argillacea MUCL 33604]
MQRFTFFCERLESEDVRFIEMEVDDSVVIQHLTTRIWERWLQPLKVKKGELTLTYSSSGIPINPRDSLWSRVRECENRGQLTKPGYTDLISGLITCARTEFQLVVHISSGGRREVHSDERAHSTAVNNAHDAPSPSSVTGDVEVFKAEQEIHPIYNGRPNNLCSSPIAIYNNAFAVLRDTLSDLTRTPAPNRTQVVTTANLLLSATKIYDSDWDRGDALLPHVERLLDVHVERHVKVATTKETYKANGFARQQLADPSYTERGAYVYIEAKNELGIGGDSGLQGALTLLKHISHDRYERIRNASCCPCIVISIAGPYVCFSGAVLVGGFIVQPFTDYVYLGGDPFMNDRIIHVAKIFDAVRNAATVLRDYYDHLLPRRERNRERLLPSPTYSLHQPTLPLKFIEQFHYQGRQTDNHRRSLFRGKFGDEIVLVKFCETYNERAHRELAHSNLAPPLHFCSKIHGGIMMVVMGFVEGRDAHYQFKNQKLPADIMDDVKSAIHRLHEIGLVFGDLRRPNIMIVPKDLDAASAGEDGTVGVEEKEASSGFRAMLVDFDWAGEHGHATYPALLNYTGEIDWADGVKPAAVMKKQHDLDMIGKLNPKSFR